MKADRRGTFRFASFLLALAFALASAAAGARQDPAHRGGHPLRRLRHGDRDVRFAGELRSGTAWKAYDDLGCLLRAAREDRSAPVWLTDYDTRTLHAADSLWVVKAFAAHPDGERVRRVPGPRRRRRGGGSGVRARDALRRAARRGRAAMTRAYSVLFGVALAVAVALTVTARLPRRRAGTAPGGRRGHSGARARPGGPWGAIAPDPRWCARGSVSA